MRILLALILLTSTAHGKTRWWYTYKGHPPHIVYVLPRYRPRPAPRRTYHPPPRLKTVKRPMGAVYQGYVEPLEILNPYVK